MTVITTLIGVMNISYCSDIIIKAATVANEGYLLNHKTSVLWHHDEDNVNRFLRQFKGTVVTIEVGNDLYFHDKTLFKKFIYNQTVILTTDPNDFKVIIEKINKARTFPIYVILVVTDDTVKNLAAFTKIAWENDVSDILILSKDTDNNVILSTFMPYTNDKCGDYTPVYLNADAKLHFINKYMNFHKCPMRATVLELVPYVKMKFENNTLINIAGIDGVLLKLIAEILNATLVIVNSDNRGGFGGIVNGTQAGYFTDLVYNKTDIIAPALILATTRYESAQISYTADVIHVIWCTPSRRQIYAWATIILPFADISTILIGIAFAIKFTTIKVVRKYGTVKDETKNDVTFRMLGIFLGQDTKFLSRYWLINCLYVCWIWFCIIVRISYQGNLVDGLQKVLLEPRITTLNEALAVIDEIGGLSIYRDFYTKNAIIQKKFESLRLNELQFKLQEIVDGKRYILAIDFLEAVYLNSNFEMLDERVGSAPTSIHMRARWPAAPKITKLITRLVETGLYIRIRRHEVTPDKVFDSKRTKPRRLKALGLDTVDSCFYGLIIMYVVSLIVLFGEIYWVKYKKPKHSNKQTRVRSL